MRCTHSSLRGEGKPCPITLVSSATTPTPVTRATRTSSAIVSASPMPGQLGPGLRAGRDERAGVACQGEARLGSAPRASIASSTPSNASPAPVGSISSTGSAGAVEGGHRRQSAAPRRSIFTAARRYRSPSSPAACAAGPAREHLGLALVREHRGRLRGVLEEAIGTERLDAAARTRPRPPRGPRAIGRARRAAASWPGSCSSRYPETSTAPASIAAGRSSGARRAFAPRSATIERSPARARRASCPSAPRGRPSARRRRRVRRGRRTRCAPAGRRRRGRAPASMRRPRPPRRPRSPRCRRAAAARGRARRRRA